jgi:hypothetical protein
VQSNTTLRLRAFARTRVDSVYLTVLSWPIQ